MATAVSPTRTDKNSIRKARTAARHAATALVVGVRQAARNSRTSEQQLNELDERLGFGIGAVRERARLSG